MERTSMHVRDFTRRVPKPIVVTILINGQPARALIDCGSDGDFISTILADQLKLKRDILAKPLTVRLAVRGSRSKITSSTNVNFQYQGINEDRRFDVSNLDNYDIILGTPFIYQHQVLVGMNPTRIVVGSDESLELCGTDVTEISSAAADIFEDDLEKVRIMLKKEAEDLCPDTATTALPPLRAINHVIPLIDDGKIYRYRLARCPEALKPLWRKKRDEYLANGRWRWASGNPSSPLMVLMCSG
ncbi:hypothetical protein M378DRAFT_187566 [Amanita muscaria Koide BX008]|uniref:Uncharacterized protein n=1 Tax=Amanita muscaria (strain Koide BX008) TaxID=946122 RepID=A0A0C2SEJ0_AMAMK|nr:hypothetical protein M378DRAFT_187566 [Amanita muscaria Koide BX008]